MSDAPSLTQHGLTQHGKISYLQIPAVDVEQSAAFYAEIFGWTLRGTPAHRSFSDASEQLIGAFVTHLTIASEPGVLPYLYVQGLDATLARIAAKGCSIHTPPYPEGDLWVATFRDPAGNVIGCGRWAEVSMNRSAPAAQTTRWDTAGRDAAPRARSAHRAAIRRQ